MAAETTSTPTIIRRKTLERRIGLAHSAIYDRLDKRSPRYDPTFPTPIKLGVGKNPPIGFIEEEVNSWINAQIQKSRAGGVSR